VERKHIKTNARTSARDKKRLLWGALALFTAFFMLAPMLPPGVLRAAAAPEAPVYTVGTGKNYATPAEALSTIGDNSGEPYVIELYENFAVDAYSTVYSSSWPDIGNIYCYLPIPADAKVTIRSAEGQKFAIDASGLAGGKIIYVEPGAKLTLESVIIKGAKSNNGVLRDGSGIYNRGDTTIIDCEISGNISERGDGGGIYNEGEMEINGCEISGNNSEWSGGGICNEGEMEITGCVISGNHTGDEGGGIYNDGEMTIADSTVRENTADDDGEGSGGGIFNAGELTIDNSAVTDNWAPEEGGGIYSGRYSNLSITTGSEIGYNTSGVEVADFYAEDSYGGGGIFFDGDKLTITGSTISYNTANCTGDMEGGGGGIYCGDGEINITNSIISWNTANSPEDGDGDSGRGYGGGIYNVSYETITITGGEISHNTAAGSGGGICSWAGLLIINGVTISDNSATGTTGVEDDQGSGGGIFCDGDGIDELSITNSKISHNSAADFGGGVYVGYYTPGGQDIDWDHYLETGGYPDGEVVYIDVPEAYIMTYDLLSISGVTFTGNSAGELHKLTEEDKDPLPWEPDGAINSISVPALNLINGFTTSSSSAADILDANKKSVLNNYDIGYMGAPVAVCTVTYLDADGEEITSETLEVGINPDSTLYTIDDAPFDSYWVISEKSSGLTVSQDDEPVGEGDSLEPEDEVDLSASASGAVFLTFAATSDGSGSLYAVTYDGNGNTGGAAPVDAAAPYAAGANVTVLGPGTLVRTSYSFSGWNTQANGSGISYAAGAAFTIESDATLYAQWTYIPYVPPDQPKPPEPDDPPDDPEPPDIPVPPAPPESGGNSPAIPPVPNYPGDNVELSDDGVYIERDEDGTPLGEWRYDEDEGAWIFEEYPPLGAVEAPQTGDAGILAYAALFAVSLLAAAAVLTARRRAE
jgi:hypothetical protein